jgi:hypothetical protein
MSKKGKEERGVLVAGRRGSGSQPKERGSRPRTPGAPASHGASNGASRGTHVGRRASERGATDLSPDRWDDGKRFP